MGCNAASGMSDKQSTFCEGERTIALRQLFR
jgi:hypothetical protein